MAATFAQHRISSPAGEQNYLAAGAGKPLVLLHGLGAYAATWTSVIERFSSQYRVIAIDLAGHGTSDPAEGPITFAHALDGVAAVIAHEVRLVESGPCILVGHSLGAWLGCLYTLAHPENVERAVLVNGPPLSALPTRVKLQPANREEAARLFQASRAAIAPMLDDTFLDAYVEYANSGPIARLSHTESDVAPYRLDGKLREFPRPADLLWGMDDRLVPFSTAERLLRELPAVRMTELYGCGHVPQTDCKQAFLAGLQQILEQPAPEGDLRT
jgi:pimeloyl-ACP methyl ester carboxylesterase